eukprot:14030342-Alexandrium_andersonii.AAC.1
MSASLVGSEMCIRDRSRVPRQGRKRQSGGPQRRRSAPIGRGRPRPPVSYTHLTLPTICSV